MVTTGKIIDKLKQKDPEKNFLFTAIETLENPEEIKEFREEYTSVMKEQGTSDRAKEHPKEVADDNICIVLDKYFDDAISDKWFEALPDLKEKRK